MNATLVKVEDPEEMPQWICPLCNGRWEHESQAKWCCQEETWECECGWVYMSESEAQACCTPEPQIP